MANRSVAVAKGTASAKAPDTRIATSVRIDPELMIGLKSMSVRERMPVNDIITEAVRALLTRKGYIGNKAA
jgi:hypothetical protein